jgi:hypothetical protein
VSQQYTVQRTTYSPLLKVANAACGVAHALNLPLTDLDQDSLLRGARRMAKLDDWGDSDFLEPLGRLLSALQGLPMTPLARVVARQSLMKAVVNRLRIQDYVTRHPEVEQVPIKRPIFILGFPRTGTTLLQNLLSLDEGIRALQFWELLSPCPVHPDPELDRKKRIAQTDAIIRAAYVVAPEQRYIHAITSTTAEECWPLFYTTFAALNTDLQSAVKPYGDWLLSEADMTGPYREYRRQLQIMAHWKPTGQFVLKCPEHLWFLDTLLEVFPDACVVWTHRDPADSVASYCSMISLTHRLWYGAFKHEELGAYIEDRFLSGVTRAMAARAEGDPRFFDVDFRTLVKDPAVMVRRIKEHFGLDHTEVSEAAVAEWLAVERSDTRGMHLYSAGQFGLDRATIHQRYAAYIDRFQIPLRTDDD